MQRLNDKCKQWKEIEHIDYSVYGTPEESTTYKFAKSLQKRFGIIEGITDKNYVTNSYHIPVFVDIDAFSKLSYEARLQKLSPGGAISYVEAPNMENNVDAILPSAAFSMVLREIAIELDKKYKDHINNSPEIYVISLLNGKITKATKAHIKNYRNFAAFRSIEDAKIACRITKDILKEMFKSGE